MKAVFLLVLILFWSNLFGQTGIVDSVAIKVANAKTTRERIEILNGASSKLMNADLKKSFDYAQKARKLAIESNDDIGLAHAALNTGKYYTRVGMFDKAMENYIQSLEISERNSDESLKGLVLKVIGNNYYFKRDYSLAKEYYKRALVINQKFKDEETTADLHNNIALIFIESQQMDSAISYLQLAVAPYERLNKKGKLANTFLNIGLAMARQGLNNEAIVYYKKALVLNQTMGLALQEGMTLNNIAAALIEMKRFDDADVYVKKALIIGERENFMYLLVEVYQNMAVTNRKPKDFPDIMKKLLSIKDSLYSERNSKQIEELRTKYESEQKERENEYLLQESAQNEKQLTFIRSLLFFIGLFAIIVTSLAIISYRAMVRNRRAKIELTFLNSQIKQQNEEIHAQSDKLKIANDEIAVMNENLQSLVDEKTSKIFEQSERLIQYTFHNSHRVRGPLTRIMGLINLKKIGEIDESETSYLIEEIDRAANELDEVLKDINHTLSNTLTGDENQEGKVASAKDHKAEK